MAGFVRNIKLSKSVPQEIMDLIIKIVLQIGYKIAANQDLEIWNVEVHSNQNINLQHVSSALNFRCIIMLIIQELSARQRLTTQQFNQKKKALRFDSTFQDEDVFEYEDEDDSESESEESDYIEPNTKNKLTELEAQYAIYGDKYDWIDVINEFHGSNQSKDGSFFTDPNFAVSLYDINMNAMEKELGERRIKLEGKVIKMVVGCERIWGYERHSQLLGPFDTFEEFKKVKCDIDHESLDSFKRKVSTIDGGYLHSLINKWYGCHHNERITYDRTRDFVQFFGLLGNSVYINRIEDGANILCFSVVFFETKRGNYREQRQQQH